MKAAGENRWGHRDATAILIAYRHGLRASELVALRWDSGCAGHITMASCGTVSFGAFPSADQGDSAIIHS
jgi:hypothetical protein